MIEWINFSFLLVSLFLFSYFYTLSVQPIKREKRKGERAWKECMKLRIIASVFEFIIVLTLIFWIWFPLPLINWKVHPNYVFGFIIGVVISIPCLAILLKGVRDAGSETLQPSKDTEIYGGIYNYVRHPQSLGEFPLFLAIAFMVNSWFLVLLMVIYTIIYVPIMIYYEEQDLIRRFGEKYQEYQKRTGAFFPKIRKKKVK
ncbi:MAG: isoprenylcysteine carboxylmethyltransferase family protein [Promethearchaeia archaeon]